jgi:hypothetical protein
VCQKQVVQRFGFLCHRGAPWLEICLRRVRLTAQRTPGALVPCTTSRDESHGPARLHAAKLLASAGAFSLPLWPRHLAVADRRPERQGRARGMRVRGYLGGTGCGIAARNETKSRMLCRVSFAGPTGGRQVRAGRGESSASPGRRACPCLVRGRALHACRNTTKIAAGGGRKIRKHGTGHACNWKENSRPPWTNRAC